MTQMADEAKTTPSEAPDAPWNYHTPGPDFELDDQIESVWLYLDGSPNGSHDHVPTKAYDVVERPAHYNQGEFEVIDIIQDKLTPEQFRGYAEGNVLKYVLRHQYKGNPVQDLEKARWYLDRLIKAFGHDTEV